MTNVSRRQGDWNKVLVGAQGPKDAGIVGSDTVWILFHYYGKSQENFKETIDMIPFAFKTTFAAGRKWIGEEKALM